MNVMPASRQDDEIDLRAGIEAVIKRKGVLLTVFCVSILFAAIRGFNTPDVYEVAMIIEPPVNAITDTGVQNWDTVANIKSQIEVGAYNSQIINELNLKNDLHFDITLPKDTRLIKVSLRKTLDEAASGKNTLTKLLEALNRSYAKIISDKQNRIGNQIKLVLSQINSIENEINLQNEQFKLLTDRERQLTDDVKEAKTNEARLLAKREAIFERKENKDDIAALFYAATIQHNAGYLTQLKNGLLDLKGKRESILNTIANLKNSINDKRVEIINLNLSKDSVQNIRLIQEPLASMQPVGPNRTRNILIAGALGLIAGLFLVFCITYWESAPSSL